VGERRRKRILILLLIAAGLIAAGWGVWSYIHSPERKARYLIAELRGEQHQWFEKLLAKVGVSIQSSDYSRSAVHTPEQITEELIALGPAAVPVLIESLPPPSEHLCGFEQISADCIIKALGKSRDPRAYEPLVALLEKCEDKQSVIVALRDLGDVRAVGPLVEQLRKVDWRAIRVIIERFGDASVDPLVEASQRNPWFCAHALASIGTPRAVDALLAMFNRLDCDTSLIAAVELLHDARAVDRLIEIMTDQNIRLQRRICAAQSLGLIGDARAVGPLIQVIEEPLGDIGSGQAAIALAEIGDLSSTEALIRLLELGLPAAADALGLLGDPRSADALAKAAAEGETFKLRERAVIALAEMADPRTVDLLATLLIDAEKQGSLSPLESVVSDCSLRARSFLARQIESRGLKGMAADATKDALSRLQPVVSERRPHRPFEELLADLANANDEQRRRVCIELATHPDPRSVDALLGFDKEDTLALDALAYRGDARALRPLWDALRKQCGFGDSESMSYGKSPIHRAIVRIRLADRRKHAATASSPATATAEYWPLRRQWGP
jgi:HEAT repeat protein